jgi:hypothetical protein
MKIFFQYVHLLAVCISVGSLLLLDFELLRKRGEALIAEEIKALEKTAKVMIYALFVLWVTGVCLVIVGYLDRPDTYLANQKLWAKFSVVFILTINGIFLHYFSFPRVASRFGILAKSWDEQMLVGLTGVISTVSWLFASYLGIARHWNNTVQYSYVMTVYFLIIAVGFVFVCECLFLQSRLMRNVRNK